MRTALGRGVWSSMSTIGHLTALYEWGGCLVPYFFHHACNIEVRSRSAKAGSSRISGEGPKPADVLVNDANEALRVESYS